MRSPVDLRMRTALASLRSIFVLGPFCVSLLAVRFPSLLSPRAPPLTLLVSPRNSAIALPRSDRISESGRSLQSCISHRVLSHTWIASICGSPSSSIPTASPVDWIGRAQH